MLALQSYTFYFETVGKLTQIFDFGSTIRNYDAALQGFEFKFDTKNDNNVEIMAAEITNIILSNDRTQVTIEANFDFKDHQSNLGSGLIDIVVMADLEN